MKEFMIAIAIVCLIAGAIAVWNIFADRNYTPDKYQEPDADNDGTDDGAGA